LVCFLLPSGQVISRDLETLSFFFSYLYSFIKDPVVWSHLNKFLYVLNSYIKLSKDENVHLPLLGCYLIYSKTIWFLWLGRYGHFGPTEKQLTVSGLKGNWRQKSNFD
jgi:hypothetical protein